MVFQFLLALKLDALSCFRQGSVEARHAHDVNVLRITSLWESHGCDSHKLPLDGTEKTVSCTSL